MSSQITCPTCGMSASSTDHRQLMPVPAEPTPNDLRRCRNCGDLVVLQADRSQDPTRRVLVDRLAC